MVPRSFKLDWEPQRLRIAPPYDEHAPPPFPAISFEITKLTMEARLYILNIDKDPIEAKRIATEAAQRIFSLLNLSPNHAKLVLLKDSKPNSSSS